MSAPHVIFWDEWASGWSTKLEALVDDFDDNSFDTVKWKLLYNEVGASFKESNRQLNFNINTITGAYVSVASVGLYEIAGSSFRCKFADLGAHVSGWDRSLGIGTSHDLGDGLYFDFQHSSPTVTSLMLRVGGQSDVFVNLSYAPWWVRAREVNGTTYMEYSADGLTWTLGRSIATALAFPNGTLVYPYFEIGNFNSTGGSTYTVSIDDVNVPVPYVETPVQVVPLSLTPSSTDVASFADSNTEALALTPDSTQVFAGVDSATVYEYLDVANTVDRSDNFNDNSLDTVRWATSGTITEQNQRIEFATAGTLTHKGYLPLTGTLSCLFVAATAPINMQFIVRGVVDGNENAHASVTYDGTDITASIRNDSAVNIATGSAAAALPFYIRAVKLSPGLQIDYSTDGTSWTTLVTVNTDYKWMRRTRTQLAALQSTPHIFDEYIAIDTAIEYLIAVDSGTLALALTPSATDTAQYVDTNTEALALTPSSADIADYVDSNTESFKLTPRTTSEFTRYVEAPPDINKLGEPDELLLSQGVQDPAFYYAQSFVPSAGLIRAVEMVLRKTGSPLDNFIVELRTASGANPSSTVLATATIAASTVPTSPAIVEIPFSEAILVSNTTYWIVVRRSGAVDNINRISAYFNPAVTETAKFSNNSGSSWGALSFQFGYGVRFVLEPTDIIFSLTPSSTDTAQYIEANTELLGLTPSATPENAQYVETATEVLGLTPSATDTAEYVDAQTESFAFTPSATEVAQFIDADTEALALTPNTTAEEHTTYDVETELFALTPSGTDDYTAGAAGYTDADTEVLALIPSATEVAESAEDGVEAFALSPSSVDVSMFADSATPPLTLTPEATDTAQFVDASTGVLELQPSGTETRTSTDADIETFLLIPSGVENIEYGDSGTESFSIVPSGSDIGSFADDRTETFTLTPTAGDVATTLDSGREELNLSPSGVEYYETSADFGTEVLTLVPITVTETQTTYDTSVEVLVLVPSGTDFPVYADALVVPIRLTAGGYDFFKLIDLVGRLIERRYLLTSEGLTYSAQIFTHYAAEIWTKFTAIISRKWGLDE